MESPGDGKQLRTTSLVLHMTRGIIRDRKTRRAAMLVAVFVAIVLAICGATFLAPFLNPREHLLRFGVFWFACAWTTLLALLLALFDVLIGRVEARAEERDLKKRFSVTENVDPPALS